LSVLPGRAGNNFYLTTEVLREKVESCYFSTPESHGGLRDCEPWGDGLSAGCECLGNGVGRYRQDVAGGVNKFQTNKSNIIKNTLKTDIYKPIEDFWHTSCIN
jgi:hypothetical protein